MTVITIQLGWLLFKSALGSADDMRCVNAASQSRMGGCPLYNSESELPANHFFATIDGAGGGKCACPAPQDCSY
jgi:hypothetical protein